MSRRLGAWHWRDSLAVRGLRLQHKVGCTRGMCGPSGPRGAGQGVPEPCMHVGPMLTCASAAGAMALVLALLGLLSLTTSPVLVRGPLLTWVAVACYLAPRWGHKLIKYACCLPARPALHTSGEAHTAESAERVRGGLLPGPRPGPHRTGYACCLRCPAYTRLCGPAHHTQGALTLTLENGCGGVPAWPPETEQEK